MHSDPNERSSDPDDCRSQRESYSWVEFYCAPGDHFWRCEGLISVGIGEFEWCRPCVTHADHRGLSL